MGITELEMQRLLRWVDCDHLAKIKVIKDDQDRMRAFDDLIKRYSRARLDDERDIYVRACVGEKVWIHLPGDERMNLFEGIVESVEVVEGGLLAKLRDKRYPGELIEFDPLVTMPHYYKKRKTQ